jgi:N utilization substance protein B
MSKARTRARRAAVQAIYQWQLTGQDASEIEDHFLHDHDMAGVDENFFHEIIREVPLHLHELEDHFIPLLDRPVTELDPVERAILRLGTYELEFRPDIPYRVVINEAVELAKSFGAEDGHRYINSILDLVAGKLRQHEVRH